MQNNYCKSTPPRVYEAEKLRPEDKGGTNMQKQRANAAQMQSKCKGQMHDKCKANARGKCMTNAQHMRKAYA